MSKNRFCIYTRTRAAVCCTLRILSTARAGRPNRVHRHRRHTGALYNAADTRLAAPPSCGHLLGRRLSRAAKLQRQSRGCTVRPMSCSHWPPASASAAVTAVTSHNHLTYPFLTAFLLSQVVLIRQSLSTIQPELLSAHSGSPAGQLTAASRHTRTSLVKADIRK